MSFQRTASLRRPPGRAPALAAAALLAVSAASATAADPAGIEFFEKNIRPILADHCYPCHSAQASKVKGSLRLDLRSGWEKGGASGPALVAGKPAESLLLHVVRGTAKDVEPMPPKGEGRAPLTGTQIAALEEWIRMGAPDPRDDTAAAPAPDPSRHWAFQRPVEPPPPAVRNTAWPRRDLDRHVLAQLEAHGLTPMPEAGKRTLLRRVTHDLTGLPPRTEDMESFLADASPDAYERAVDRLLASPEYGERWGRWWLDIARYADSKGYVFEEERRYAYSYTYRDWVVQAFNRDLPYDRFLKEQIAGDQLASADDPWPMAALGFLTLGRRFLNNEADIIDDRLDVVFRGTQALTVGCARCHDHKSDPIPTADYYSLYGVFASSQEPGEKPLLGANPNPHQAAAYADERARREKELADYQAAENAKVIRKLRERVGDYLVCAEETRGKDGSQSEVAARARSLDPRLVEAWKRESDPAKAGSHPILGVWLEIARGGTNDFAADTRAALERLASRNPAPNAALLEAFRRESPTNLADAGRILARVANDALSALDKAREDARKAGEPEPAALTDAAREALRRWLSGDESPIQQATRDIGRFYDVPVAQKVRALRRKVEELDATHPGAPLRAMALIDKPSPVEPVVFKRGNPGNHGPRVPRQFLGILAGPGRKPFDRGSGRLQLAEAIASPDNPLTARVLVNRVWGRHFGVPLVKSPADFGVRTEAPANPALLDHLAVRFMKSGWSIKQLHREILLSATYRQSSEPGRDALAAFTANEKIDPANQWHWRMNRKRHDFEALRDSLLLVTGSLDRSLGGQPVEMFQDKVVPRRTLYGFIDRQNLPGLLRSFDFASPDTTSAMRFQTTVPQQALFMMNNPFLLELARNATRSPGFRAARTDAERIRWLHRQLLQRAPDPDEEKLGAAFVSAHMQARGVERPAADWTYGVGRYDEQTRQVTGFRPFLEFKDNRWQMAKEFPAKNDAAYASLSARSGHPGRNADFSVIRRWKAPVTAIVSLNGELEHPGKEGDGVRARVVSSRSGLVAEWTAKSGKTPTHVGRIEVQAGEILDLIVDPVGGDNTDSFNWAPVLASTALAGSASSTPPRTWDSARDFRGPAEDPQPLDGWGRYAQVLLSSNEFVFVD